MESNGYAIFTSQFTPRLPFDLRHNGARVRILGSSTRGGATFLYEIEAPNGSTAWVAPWELQPPEHKLQFIQRMQQQAMGYSKLDKEAKV